MPADTHESAIPGAFTARWFCVQTKPRAEAEAEAQLARQDFRVFLPRLRARRPRPARGVVTVVEPLFPRYLFLHADPLQQSLASVRSTRGVSGLVRFGGEPAVVPTRLIEALMAQADANAIIDTPPETFAPGERVRVVDGPLAGLVAIYREPLGAARAVVLLELLGQPQPVSLPWSWLCKTDTRAA